MKGLEIRKTIALGMTAALILFTGYCIVTGRTMPETFVALVGPVIGYYFGKSTALEMPKVQ